jgi:hypothetical protein
LHGQQYSPQLLANRILTEIEEHGADDYQPGDRQRSQETGPKAKAIIGHNEGGFAAGKSKPRLARQQSVDHNRKQYPAAHTIAILKAS